MRQSGRLVAVLAAVLLIASVASPADARPEPSTGWIVTLTPSQDVPEVARALSAAHNFELEFVYENVLGGFSFTGPESAAAALERNPRVSSVTAQTVFTLEEFAGWGIFRIEADQLHNLDGGVHRGAGIRVAVIDSGIDLDHPDLAPNMDTAAGRNCVDGSPPDDDHSHGTHVAGIIAAAYNSDGFGVVGVAPQATLVPVKVFASDGTATTAQVICGIDHVAGLAADGIPTVANMSFGEEGSDSVCDDADTTDTLHEAVCDLANTGVIPVAAAGNSSTSASTLLPGAFSEVITVSALTDFDGEPGGLAGCSILYGCDDYFASYSNYGPVDVIAPGTQIYSTLPGGGHGTKSGSSMAAPHVAGVVAAMLGANDTLATDQIRFLLQTSGECPEPAGSLNADGGATCTDQGQWPGDPDGITEPLVNALRATQAVVDLGAGPVDFPPSAGFTTVCTDLTCDFTDTSTDFEGSIVSWGWDFGDGMSSTDQSPSHAFSSEGTYSVELTVTDEGGNSDTVSSQVQVPTPYSPSVQGDWVGVYGADGHVLAAWEGGSDLVSFPFAGVILEQGSRYRWTSSTGEIRALGSPDETERRAATFYDSNQIRVRLDFTADYSGDLHLYALDWDTTERRQIVKVDDGSGPQVVNIDASFNDGAWMSFPISVSAGASVTITIDLTAGANAVLSGIFLGNGAAGESSPTASDDTASTLEDTPVNIDVLTNDSDADGNLDPSTLAVTAAPSNGSTQVETDNTITYAPGSDYNGTDTFTYQVCDSGGLCDIATVTITVTEVNDPPTASDDTASTLEDTPVNIDVLTNDSDADGNLDPSTLAVTAAPSNGSTQVETDNTITYAPGSDYNGTDTFTYQVCDSGGLCDIATVTITVTEVNDPPTASDDTASTLEDTPVNIDVLTNDSDVDDTTLTVTNLVQPANGAAVIEADNTITYTPAPGFSGIDTFTYTANDGLADSNTATVTITVTTQRDVVEQFAQSEETVDGSVSGGSMMETYSSDDVFEELTEEQSGGRPQNRQSFLDHRWSFSIDRGDSIEVAIEGFRSPNSDGDDFAFEYSVDGGATFLPLFMVVASNIPTSYSGALPADTSGEVLIRVIDTDRTPGNAGTDTVFVDLLVIRTTNPLPRLPIVTVAASGATASETGDSGTFTVHRNDSFGPLTVYYTVAGTATNGSDYETLTGSVTFVDGQADALITVLSVDDAVAEGDESVDLSLSTDAGYTLGTPSTATVVIADDDTSGSESRAQSDNSVYGSVVSGTYLSTHFADGNVQVIEEELYSGSKRSRLEHQWTFDLASGSTVTFFLLADQIGSETFTFSYSTDGSAWTDMPIGASGTQESFVLHSGTDGTVYVRVVDDDRSRGEANIDGVRIDEMYFLSVS